MTTTVSPLDRSDATNEERYLSQWRDWRRYLQARITLTTITLERPEDAFERETAREDEQARAERQLSILATERRAVFEMVVTEQRAALAAAQDTTRAATDGTRAHMVDPDAIDLETLEILLGETEGRTTSDNWGRVPMGTTEKWRWYKVDVAALEAAPDEASYVTRVGRMDERTRGIVFSVSVGVAALVFVLAWFLWPRSTPAVRLAGAATLNGTPIPLQPPVTLQVERADRTSETLPISAVEHTNWPALASDEQRAYWWSAAARPLVMCVGEGVLKEATTVRIGSGGITPVRVYALRATDDGSADLRLLSCNGDTPTHYGILQPSPTPPTLTVGESARLEDTLIITASSVTISGPGDDTTLPAEQARVAVAVQLSEATDLTRYAPTLTILNGQALLPAETLPLSDGIELRYLVPSPRAPQEVVWSVTSTEPGAAARRWRTTLPVPLDHATRVWQSIYVRDVQCERRTDGKLSLTLTVERGGDASLTLRDDDLVVTQGSQRLSVTSPPELGTPLLAGETRTLTWTLTPSASSTDALLITLGRTRVQIAQ